jgi:hypothetical protein
MIGLMNDTKWDELRRGMYELGELTPKWRTRDVLKGFVSPWDLEWFYHFRNGGYDTIEWVDIATTTDEQRIAVRRVLRSIHVPGEEADYGFRVFGYAPPGQYVEYL